MERLFMIKLKQILLEGLGDCYPAGGRLIMSFFGDKEHKLVHGMVNGQGALEGMRYGHCWVESRDTVLDHSNGRKLEIPTQVYYALGRVNPKECKYYTAEEAAKFMVDEGHWGPWEMTGDTVMAEEIPDRKPEVGKQDIKINPNELDNIESKLTQEIPEFFYHATYKALLPSIKATGLDTREAALAWEDSKPGIVYLANDPGVAESYAEAADDVSDEIYDSGIVILKVASKDLNLSKLHDDSNVIEDDSDTYEYHGQIPWSKLKMASLSEIDYHAKLSRGHKPDHYQLGTSEFIPFDENTAPDHDGKAAPYGSGYDEVEENFADGKKPGRKGISKRVGIPKGATLTQLAKLAKAKGEKGRMARWQLNMRRGRKKASK